jgi:DNA-directed RNA polymerase specialized sigma24 family protein
MTAAPVIVSYGEVDVLQLESREPLHLESVEQLQVCLDGISEDQRELLEDVYIHGTTQSALAKKYKISSSAVACRVEKAKWDARRAWRRESTKDEKPWRGKVETCDHVNPIDRYYSRILNRVK